MSGEVHLSNKQRCDISSQERSVKWLSTATSPQMSLRLYNRSSDFTATGHELWVGFKDGLLGKCNSLQLAV